MNVSREGPRNTNLRTDRSAILPGGPSVCLRFVRVAAALGATIATANCTLALNGTGADGTGDAAAGALPDAGLAGTSSEKDSGFGAPGTSPGIDAAVGAAGGGSLCATANLLFCDGFENGSSAWTAAATHGSVVIDSSKAYRGAHSLHAQTDAVTGTSQQKLGAGYGHLFVPAPAFPVFVRMFVYMPSPVPPSVGAFVNILQSLPPYAGVQLNVRPPGGYLGGTGYNGLDSDWSSANDLVPANSWACLELEIDGAPSNLVHVFVSDVELTAMREGLPADVPPLGLLQVGLAYYAANAQPATDLWIDEVAVDGKRIGCSL
jgi:hypothetical protein